ncbi:MAG: hypothetical protein ACYC1Q_07725 [Bacteroidia bacterium]
MDTQFVISKETPYEDACKLNGAAPMTLADFEKFPENQRQYMFSMHRVVTVIEAQKQDRLFDWNDEDQDKYSPWWDMETYGEAEPGSGFAFFDYVGTGTDTYVGARLSNFSSEETRFIAEVMFEDYKVIMKDQGK